MFARPPVATREKNEHQDGSTEEPPLDDDDEHFDVFVAGSRYRVHSASGGGEPLISTGVFLGFTNFGMNEQGLRIELTEEHGEEKGKVRVIPLPNVLFVDVLEQKRRPPAEKPDEEHHAVFYT